MWKRVFFTYTVSKNGVCNVVIFLKKIVEKGVKRYLISLDFFYHILVKFEILYKARGKKNICDVI